MVDKLELQQVQAASRALIAAVEHAWARDSRRAGRKVEEASAILKQLGVTHVR